MFPIIWRFLLKQYLRVTLFCCVAIVLILFTTRLDEIARFASLDPSLKQIALFVINQVPFVVPMAIPIACLISSILLVQGLSKTHELTALRACGIGLRDLIFPILAAGFFLAIVNFYFVSELTTRSHFNTNLWKDKLRSLNPLLILKNQRLIQLRGGYFDVMGPTDAGSFASQVVFAFPDGKTGAVRLFLADRLEIEKDQLRCHGVTVMTTIGNAPEEGFDSVAVENMAETTMAGEDFIQLMQRKSWSIENDHLTMAQLLSRIRETQERRDLHRCYTEIVRRISAALAALTFTLMGASFGISISRHHSQRGVIAVIVITSIYLALFFASKNFQAYFYPSLACYLLPHIVITLLSVRMLRRAAQGIEGG